MNRRHFLSTTALTAGHLAFAQPGIQPNLQSGTARPVRITIDEARPGPLIPPDFLGLGYEIASVARPGLLSRTNTLYTQLVRTLSPAGVIRIGGNTADYATYTPTGQPVSTPYGSVVNDAVLHDLGTFLEATNWKLIWALNLGQGNAAHPGAPSTDAAITQAIAEARAITATSGPHLLAFEIGNEPDLFPNEKHRPASYTYEAWLAEYRRFKAALRAALPNLPFAGPDVAGRTDWVTRYAADEGPAADRNTVLLTHHYYRGNQSPESTIAQLLGPDPKLQPTLDQLRAASRSSGLPYRICEVNSFSGGGRPGVSDTFAAALWVLDYLYTLASNGCAGVNMETGVNQRDFISSYSPIGDDEHGHYTARPEYYGLLAFTQGARGHLLKTTLTLSGTTPDPGLKAYATQSGPDSITLTLINKGPTSALISVDPSQMLATGAMGQPFRPERQATILRLTGPSLDARTGITLGSSEVAPDATWKPGNREPLHSPVRNTPLSFNVPAASAAILFLDSFH